MALILSAVADRIDHGTGSSLDNIDTGAVATWIKLTTGTGYSALWQKGLAASGFQLIGLNDGSAGEIFFAKATTSTNPSHVSVEEIAIGVWTFVGVTWDFSVDLDQLNIHIYLGDRSTPAVESTYDGGAFGLGSLVSNAGRNAVVGNNEPGANDFNGEIANFKYWNRVLTLSDLIAQQYGAPVGAGCLLHTEYGINGTGTQADWSGNGNNGTVTGSAVSDHAPIPKPFSRREAVEWETTPGGITIPVASSYYRRRRAG